MSGMRDMLRIGALGLVTGTLLVMLYHAPVAVFRELQFVLLILLVTVTTRSMPAESGVRALAMGMGIVVMLVVGAGLLLTSMAFDSTEGFTNWGIIPLAEEALKLVPVVFGAAMYARQRKGVTANPSDLLMLGCFAGAGFALVENVALIQNGGGAIERDMARQYGPNLAGFYLVPGAWGAVGYAGHAAATGFIAGGYGLGRALQPKLGARWWIVPAVCAAWIVIEHMFVNMYVNAGWRVAMMFGNGALTPWLFVGMTAAIVTLDVMRHRDTTKRSPILTWRMKLTRAAMLTTKPPMPRSRAAAARMYLAGLRTVNAAGWYAHAYPPPANDGAPQPKLETV